MNRGHEDDEPRFTFAKPKWTPEQMKNVIAARKSLEMIFKQITSAKQKKRLTEFIGEEWNNQNIFNGPVIAFSSNRTFDTWPDLGACMEALVKEGLWHDFCSYAWGERPREDQEIPEHFAWLFCLSGEGYVERCQMVAEFLEVKERGRGDQR